jgi:hypothetical protein
VQVSQDRILTPLHVLAEEDRPLSGLLLELHYKRCYLVGRVQLLRDNQEVIRLLTLD